MAETKPERATQLNIRVDDDLKALLEESAKSNGNSLNTEIKDRLTRSLRPQRDWATSDDPKFNGLMDLIARVTFLCGPNFITPMPSSDLWYDSPIAFSQVEAAIKAIVEALRPPGDPSVPSPSSDDAETYKRLGALVAKRVLHEVVAAAAKYEHVQESFGEVVDRIRSNLETKP